MPDLLISFVAFFMTSLHALAYLIYVRFAILDKVRPNPTNWFMWTYGTLLVVVLEWDQDASLAILMQQAAMRAG